MFGFMILSGIVAAVLHISGVLVFSSATIGTIVLCAIVIAVVFALLGRSRSAQFFVDVIEGLFEVFT